METGSKWPLASTATHSLPVSHPKLKFAKVSLDRETPHGSPPEDRNVQVTRLSGQAIVHDVCRHSPF